MTREDRSLAGLGSLLAMEGGLVAGAALCATGAAALGLAPFAVVARMATAIYVIPKQLPAIQSLALVAAAALCARYVLLAAANMLANVAAFRILHELRVRLAKLGVTFHTESAIAGWANGRARIRSLLDDSEREIEADDLVIALTNQPNDELAQELREAEIAFTAIGDCTSARHAPAAIYEGRQAALAL